jgi:hypothetical protein
MFAIVFLRAAHTLIVGSTLIGLYRPSSALSAPMLYWISISIGNRKPQGVSQAHVSADARQGGMTQARAY